MSKAKPTMITEDILIKVAKIARASKVAKSAIKKVIKAIEKVKSKRTIKVLVEKAFASMEKAKKVNAAYKGEINDAIRQEA